MIRNLLVSSAFILFSLLTSRQLSAQLTVNSSNGYQVNIMLTPRTIVPTSNSCANGYNYNVTIDYKVTFTGTNPPSSLYTLQGTLGCGTATHFFDLPNGAGTGSVNSQSNVWRGVNDCATATVTSLGCTKATIEISGPGISHQFINFNVTAIPVPVKIATFAATALNNKVKIAWATASEMNSDYFVVERSVNGVDWTVVSKTAAAGNSSAEKNYEVYDEKPVRGISQYRLKEVDIDGRVQYSVISTVNYLNEVSVNVFPVPNSGNQISFSGLNDAANTSLQVQTVSGAVIYSTRLSSTSATLPELKTGMYLLRLNNTVTGQVTILRYIKS